MNRPPVRDDNVTTQQACASCGKPLRTVQGRQRYCDQACRQQAYRDRHSHLSKTLQEPAPPCQRRIPVPGLRHPLRRAAAVPGLQRVLQPDRDRRLLPQLRGGRHPRRTATDLTSSPSSATTWCPCKRVNSTPRHLRLGQRQGPSSAAPRCWPTLGFHAARRWRRTGGSVCRTVWRHAVSVPRRKEPADRRDLGDRHVPVVGTCCYRQREQKVAVRWEITRQSNHQAADTESQLSRHSKSAPLGFVYLGGGRPKG